MSAVLFIAVLVVLIVVHELGHFLVAKFFKIRVDEFGVGYPPRAFTLGTWAGTTYTINWLPFGGFVRIFGESHGVEYTAKEKKEAFIHKPRYAQAAVLAAGVIFNLVFAWLLFTATLMIGAPTSISETDAVGKDTQLIVSSVVSGSPADAVGLESGDEIVGIRIGETSPELLYPSTVASFIQGNAGKTIILEYVRTADTGEVESVSIVPAHGVLDDAPGTPAVGVAMALVAEQSLSLFPALGQSFVGTWNALKTVTVGLLGFFAAAFTGTANWAEVAGPIGIAGLIGDASSVGFVYLLYFTAFISVNLAVINMLPLPALDGGRLLFVGIEAIRRKPISDKVATILNVLGFTIIIVLMVVVSYHDIIRLFA